MSNYSTKQTSLTACNVVITGLIASHLIGVEAREDTRPQHLIQMPYETNLISPSYSQAGDILTTTNLSALDQEFVTAVSGLYSQLVENQEALGAVFEKVLHDNLWDLYER